MQNSDVYDLASITKIAATVPSLMKLSDEKLFNLDEKLGSYIELKGSNKNDLLIRDILTHQAKLKPWIPFYKNTLVEDSESK